MAASSSAADVMAASSSAADVQGTGVVAPTRGINDLPAVMPRRRLRRKTAQAEVIAVERKSLPQPFLREALELVIAFVDPRARNVGSVCLEWHCEAECNAATFRGPTEEWWHAAQQRLDAQKDLLRTFTLSAWVSMQQELVQLTERLCPLMQNLQNMLVPLKLIVDSLLPRAAERPNSAVRQSTQAPWACALREVREAGLRATLVKDIVRDLSQRLEDSMIAQRDSKWHLSDTARGNLLLNHAEGHPARDLVESVLERHFTMTRAPLLREACRLTMRLAVVVSKIGGEVETVLTLVQMYRRVLKAWYGGPP